MHSENLKHIVRYGTAADQKYLIGDFLDTYDILVINANMVSHMPSALTSFLLQKANTKEYFIDPQTHAFQHDIIHLESSSKNKKGKIKRSIKNLLSFYGEPIESLVANQKIILPKDLKDKNIRKKFCNNVLNFQLTALDNEAEVSESSRFYKFLKKKNVISNFRDLKPLFLIAPYFYLDKFSFEEWLSVNIECAQESINISKKLDKELAVEIVISQEILNNRKLLDQLIDEYNKIKVKYFLIWIDSFSEHETTKESLENFIYLIKKLKLPIINLHGGFFSIIIKKTEICKNLIGITHGLEYGEDRSVVPVGGGIPVSKFYYPKIHKRLPFRHALRAIRVQKGFISKNEYHKQICSCDECNTIIDKKPEDDFYEYGKTKPLTFFRKNSPVVMEYPLPETKEHSVRHYMWNKNFEFTQNISLNESIKKLEEIYNELESYLPSISITHCKIWSEILNENR